MATAVISKRSRPLSTYEHDLVDGRKEFMSDGGFSVNITAEPHARPRPGAESVFLCDEETQFYGDCVQRLVFDRKSSRDGRNQVLEFGPGDGTAIIQALLQSRGTTARVRGFEINPNAAALAQRNVSAFGLDHKYKVHNSCFFKGAAQYNSDVLISNPPYLPAPDDKIMMPQLFGGTDGGGLTRTLLSMGLEEVMLLVPAYADPIRTMAHAKNEGYAVVDYLQTPLPFGVYSSEPKVLNWIKGMQREGRAFFGEDSYKLLGILFRKQSTMAGGFDRFDDALETLTSI